MARCRHASRCCPGHYQSAPQSRPRLPRKPASTNCSGASRRRPNRHLLPDWQTHARFSRTHHRATRHSWSPDTVCHLISCTDHQQPTMPQQPTTPQQSTMTPTIVLAGVVRACPGHQSRQALARDGRDMPSHDGRTTFRWHFYPIAVRVCRLSDCVKDSHLPRPSYASRNPASRNSGSTVSIKYGNSSLKLTNDTVVPANPTSLIRTISSAILAGVPTNG
jgi:hypothetical protein